MRPLELKDFKDTGWNLANPKVKAHVDGILASQERVFAKYGIKRGIHVAHLMAQLQHESGAATEMVESLNYSAQQMTEVWHQRFPTIASALPYAHNEKALGIKTYGGRMGNKPAPSEDGYTYRGQGFIQTTGKNGFLEIKKLTGIDVIAQPELMIDPDCAFEIAVAEFVNYPNMLAYCEADNILAISASINVGHVKGVGPEDVVGYASRVILVKKWKKQYGV